MLAAASISSVIVRYEQAQVLLLPVVVMLCAPRVVRRAFARGWDWVERIACVPWRAVCVVGLVSLIIQIALSLLVLWPQPRVFDEFSYLLAADTFAHGRLANSQHPMWHHFETMHVLQQPTYASKYPPGQGLMLALGQALTGRPIVGAWILSALGCAAVCWMLMAWVPPRWAMAAGLFAAIHTQTLEWGQSYWGGALAMFAGALVAGAALRILRGPRLKDGFVFGIGVALLANCRPSEGLILTLILGVTLAIWMFLGTAPHAWQMMFQRVAIPVIIVMLPTLALMGYYNFRVSGSATKMPYLVHDATYAVAPPFVWQAARWDRTFRNQQVRDLAEKWELPYWQRQQSAKGLIKEVIQKARSLAVRYANPFASIVPLLFVPLAMRKDRTLRLAVTILAAFFLIAAFNQTWTQAHYMAPGVGLACGVFIVGCRHLSAWGRNRGRFGSVVLHAVVVLFVVAALTWTVRHVQSARSWEYTRAELIREKEKEGGRHLIVVRYNPDHNLLREWVANNADIDQSNVVWARELGAEDNAKLFDYYRDRRIWLFEPDKSWTRLEPYPNLGAIVHRDVKAGA